MVPQPTPTVLFFSFFLSLPGSVGWCRITSGGPWSPPTVTALSLDGLGPSTALLTHF